MHYHPSNAKFYTYGDLPLEDTLQQIEDSALSRFDRLDVSKLRIEDERRFTAPKRVDVTVPADAVVADKEKQSIVSIAWLMVNQIDDPISLDNFTLSVASDLLTSGPVIVDFTRRSSNRDSAARSLRAPGTAVRDARRRIPSVSRTSPRRTWPRLKRSSWTCSSASLVKVS